MERAAIMILAIVFVVGVVGIITTLPHEPIGATGNAVSDVSRCGQCSGYPVCGGKAEKAIDYPNACAAECDDARVIYDAPCSQIPHASSS